MPNTQQIQQHEAYARKLLDQLRELDATIHGAYYDMGRILSAILYSQLYEVLGYASMGEMVDEELSVSRSQAFRYLHTYRHFRRLGYGKTEALDFINEFTFSLISKVLPSINDKIGKRAMRNRIDEFVSQNKQINFMLKQDDYDLLQQALERCGAERREGRLVLSSSALMQMVRAFLG
jgi:hypothetical protein